MAAVDSMPLSPVPSETDSQSTLVDGVSNKEPGIASRAGAKAGQGEGEEGGRALAVGTNTDTLPSRRRPSHPRKSLQHLPVEILEHIVCSPLLDPLLRANASPDASLSPTTPTAALAAGTSHRQGLPQILVLGSLSKVFRDLTLRRHPFWRHVGAWTDLLSRSWNRTAKWNLSDSTPFVVPAAFISIFVRCPARLAAAVTIDVPGSRILQPESLLELLAALRELQSTTGLKSQIKQLTVPSLKGVKLDTDFLCSLGEALGPQLMGQLESFILPGSKFASDILMPPSKASPRPFIRNVFSFTSFFSDRLLKLGLSGMSMAWWPGLLEALICCPSLEELDIQGSCFSVNTENPPMDDGSPMAVDLDSLSAVLPNLKTLYIGGASILYTGSLANFAGLEELLIAPPLCVTAPNAGLEVEEPTAPAVSHLLGSIPEGRRTLKRLKFGYGDNNGPWIPLLARFEQLEEIWNLSWGHQDLGVGPLKHVAETCWDVDPEDEEKRISRLSRISVTVGERVQLIQADLEEVLKMFNRAEEIVIRRDLTAAWVVLGNYEAHMTRLDMQALIKCVPNGCKLVVMDS